MFISTLILFTMVCLSQSELENEASSETVENRYRDHSYLHLGYPGQFLQFDPPNRPYDQFMGNDGNYHSNDHGPPRQPGPRPRPKPDSHHQEYDLFGEDENWDNFHSDHDYQFGCYGYQCPDTKNSIEEIQATKEL
ncbi:uncharacterized protein LOC141856519 [Brevipalpus obovatus]|uniref:uncharacterized protein LOC141856519 n=1 Tax=Brevipalpus obovatus TaxID=246614 RepID=UPI003D9EADF1